MRLLCTQTEPRGLWASLHGPSESQAVLSVAEQYLSFFLFTRSYCTIISVGIIYLQLEVAVGAGCCRLDVCAGQVVPPGLQSNVVNSTGGDCCPGLLQGLLGSCPTGD